MCIAYNIFLPCTAYSNLLQVSRFSKCDICAAVKEARERTLNHDVRQWLTRIMEKHMQLQRYISSSACIGLHDSTMVIAGMNVRSMQNIYRHKAEKEPKYLSIIVDGMDQTKTNIPHAISNPKVILYPCINV